MSRAVRNVGEQMVAIKVFMVALTLGASFFGSFIFSSQTHALSVPLVHHVTSLLNDVLTGPSEPTPSRAARAASTSNPQTTEPARSRPSPRTTSGPAAPEVTALSLPTLAPVKTDWLPREVASATPVHLASAIDTPQISVHDTVPAFLRPTNQGWSIYGVLWYWWLAVIAAVGVGIYSTFRYYRNRPKSALVS